VESMCLLEELKVWENFVEYVNHGKPVEVVSEETYVVNAERTWSSYPMLVDKTGTLLYSAVLVESERLVVVINEKIGEDELYQYFNRIQIEWHKDGKVMYKRFLMRDLEIIKVIEKEEIR